MKLMEAEVVSFKVFKKLFIDVQSITMKFEGLKMRKVIGILLGLVLTMAISMATISSAQAHINIISWRPPYVSISGSQVVYKEGAIASLQVAVLNDVYTKLNVSKVIIEFASMGKNKTLDLSASPHQILNGNTEIFTVNFRVDATEVIPGSQYTYNIIVEHVNATTGPTRLVSPPLEKNWGAVGLTWLYYVVYLTAQVDASESVAKYNSYYSYYSGYSWQSIAAKQKATQAIIEKGIGDTYYGRGDYASALTQYNLANTLWAEALAAEKDWRTASDNADLNVTLTEAAAYLKEADAAVIEANAAMVTANATKIQAEAALTNAYGWYFIGIGFAIGWSFMGIGVIIYALRKPKPPV